MDIFSNEKSNLRTKSPHGPISSPFHKTDDHIAVVSVALFIVFFV